MLPLMRKAPTGRIVNISSINGSMTLSADLENPFRYFVGAYAITKTALNAITQALSIELEHSNITVNAVCPGFTAIEINNFAGTGTVVDAAKQPVRLALSGDDGPNGTFSNSEGLVPW